MSEPTGTMVPNTAGAALSEATVSRDLKTQMGNDDAPPRERRITIHKVNQRTRVALCGRTIGPADRAPIPADLTARTTQRCATCDTTYFEWLLAR